MPDELQVRDLVAHLYTAADQMRPDAWSIDSSDPSAVAGALDYLIQHARATEGALRKIGQLMDELRGTTKSDLADDDPYQGGGEAPAARRPAGQASQSQASRTEDGDSPGGEDD